MKKTLTTLLILSLPLVAFCQTNTFRIDRLADSTFYLVEIVTPAPTPENPSPAAEEHPQKFNDIAQLLGYVKYLRKQANVAREQAEKLNAAAPRFEMAADKIEDVAKPLLPKPKADTPPAPPAKPTKPAKAKKAKTKQ